MFGINVWELSVLVLVGLAVFGPDRLPDAARQAARVVRGSRHMLRGVKNQLSQEMPEVADLQLRDLRPRTAVRKLLLDDLADGEPPRRTAPSDSASR